MTASILFLNRTRQPEVANPPPGPPDVAAMRRPILIGLALSGLIVLAIFVWGSFAKRSGAVVAHGIVGVDGNSKKIQHPQGGTVRQILVRNGARVAAGDLLVRLDDTQTRASLGIVTAQLTELTGRKLRLAAERDGLDELSFPAEFFALSSDAESIANGEKRIWPLARATSLQGQKAQLKERIKQYEEERGGMTRQNYCQRP